MSPETAIARAVTLCIKHGVTPDRLAQLIAERQQPKTPTAPRPMQNSPVQARIAEVLAAQRNAGAKVTLISKETGMRAQNVRSQLLVMIKKGTAFTANGADGIARFFISADAKAAWAASPEAKLVPEVRGRQRKPACHRETAKPTKRSQIRDLVAGSGASGMTCNELAKAMAMKMTSMQSHLASMAGLSVWPGKVVDCTNRWFSSPELAAAWAATACPVIKPRDGKATAVDVPRKVPTGPVITPEGVPITRVPAPAGRYEVAANELSGGFSSCRPGINPLTGKAWA